VDHITHTVADERCDIYFPTHDDDIGQFFDFLAQGHALLGFDTEGTGLDIYTAKHQLRLVQIGSATEAWVLRVDMFRDAICKALRQDRQYVAHNAPFDCLVVDRHLGVKLEDLMPRVMDTRLMGHLIDPRNKLEGGQGLRLKDMCAVYVDPAAPDTESDLTAVFNSMRMTKSSGWARIPINHRTYVTYAGLDPILARRLVTPLSKIIMQQGLGNLSTFEHELQYLTTLMQRKGILIDVPYTERLKVELLNEQDQFCDIAMDLGLDNVNSPQQVSAKLIAMGEELTERTKEGAVKVDRAVLLQLAALNQQWERISGREPNMVADAVVRAKRAGKWAETYAQSFLDLRDPFDRLHPGINSMQARTARMSINSPPLQQLPAREWKVRRSFIPDPGQVMIAVDFQAVEMRVLAAVAEEYIMQQAIASGLDLHSFTAERVFGANFTKEHRQIAKAVGFGKVYGGGAETISRQTGADIPSVKQALVAYDRTFPGIRRYSYKLIERMKSGGLFEVVTPIGRRLPVDEDRLYAATNYVVQSTARDLFAKAIVRIFKAGLGDYLLLPIHDELLGQAPVADAQDVVTEIGKLMESTFMGVKIQSSPKVVGSSWGAAYGAPEDLPTGVVERVGRRKKPGTWDQEELDVFSLL